MFRKTTAVLVVLMFALSASATAACELLCMKCSSKVHHAAATTAAGHHGQVSENHHHAHSAFPAVNTNSPVHSTTISNTGLQKCYFQGDATDALCPPSSAQTANIQKSMDKAIADISRTAIGMIIASTFSVSPPSSNSANSFLSISNLLPLRI